MEKPTFQFKEPKRKKNTGWCFEVAPFPVPVGATANSQSWSYFTGYLVGDCIHVSRSEDMSNLYHMVSIAYIAVLQVGLIVVVCHGSSLAGCDEIGLD